MPTTINGLTGVSQIQAAAVTPATLLLFVGAIKIYPATVAPSGTVGLTGQLLSRTTYALLWSFAQSSGNLSANDGAWTNGQFSPGDGSTTFRIPDYRGEFPRFWDNGRGADPGRTLGSWQIAAVESHSHAQNYGQNFGTSGSSPIGASGGPAAGVAGFNTGTYGGAAETRPRNVAMLACIFTGV